MAGVSLSLVGGYIAIDTANYVVTMNTANTVLSSSMLSDLRGIGGVMLLLLLLLGMYVFVSVFKSTWQASALILSTLVFASFVLFRSLSFVLDGLPQMTILTAYIIEIVFAILGGLLLNSTRSGLTIKTNDFDSL
ncbi:DUF4345 domain-containing protein [Marinomonas sp.]|nr:DUF4345 family protein [Marinomonas sp.]MDB4837611.1 DUF4345 domain-containing protein [Marinomonas sp.]